MPPPRESFDDDQLVAYLLGSLPEDETERLEEHSVVDDDLAARLRHVEDDLVDAYARGTLTGDSLKRFKSFYLASPRRREKTAFAQEFVAAVSGLGPPHPSVSQSAAGPRGQRARVFFWSFAAAAVLALSVGVLLLENVRLRRDLKDAEQQVAAADHRATAMSTELEERQRAAAAATQALADARAVQPLGTVALVLLPQTRGVGPTPIIAIASELRTVPLDLQIEVASSAPYEVALKDPATNQILWRSAPVILPHARQPPMVTVSVPSVLLKPQHYVLDLFELRPGTPPASAGSYAFEVVRR